MALRISEWFYNRIKPSAISYWQETHLLTIADCSNT